MNGGAGPYFHPTLAEMGLGIGAPWVEADYTKANRLAVALRANWEHSEPSFVDDWGNGNISLQHVINPGTLTNQMIQRPNTEAGGQQPVRVQTVYQQYLAALALLKNQLPGAP